MRRTKTQLLILSEETRGQSLQKSLEPFGLLGVVRSILSDGLKTMESLHSDLILIGSHLPDATICDMCRQIRQEQCYVPLMVAVEHDDKYDHVLALEIGADDYVASTINPRELVARIRAQLRRAYEYSTIDNEVLKIGNLLIDNTRGRAFLGHRALDLTPIEFRLLKFLIQNRDRVLSRTQILNQVWGYGLQPHGEELVNVNICRLRRKVENDPLDPKLILTVRGLGYRLATGSSSRH